MPYLVYPTPVDQHQKPVNGVPQHHPPSLRHIVIKTPPSPTSSLYGSVASVPYTEERSPCKDKHKESAVVVKYEEEKRIRDDAALTRMIGYLTATASEDWTLVLEMCARTSAKGDNAKEAIRALRRKFRYGEPPAQLSVARFLPRNCSQVFAAETASRKFIMTLDDLITSPGAHS
ncbi:hypothetical protein AX14_003127 [Amanita brunnescens Koide BX004]|nr:hypothetical protein AX14_003127 [Amanita brunnescens Koide BX004]